MRKYLTSAFIEGRVKTFYGQKIGMQYLSLCPNERVQWKGTTCLTKVQGGSCRWGILENTTFTLPVTLKLVPWGTSSVAEWLSLVLRCSGPGFGSWARTWHRSSGHIEVVSHIPQLEACATKIYNCVREGEGVWGR